MLRSKFLFVINLRVMDYNIVNFTDGSTNERRRLQECYALAVVLFDQKSYYLMLLLIRVTFIVPALTASVIKIVKGFKCLIKGSPFLCKWHSRCLLPRHASSHNQTC